MGQEEEKVTRLAAFEGFTVDDDLVELTAPDGVVLHCLPTHRGEEIAESVLEGPRGGGLAPAAHRRTAIRGILAWAVEGSTGEGAASGRGGSS